MCVCLVCGGGVNCVSCSPGIAWMAWREAMWLETRNPEWSKGVAASEGTCFEGRCDVLDVLAGDYLPSVGPKRRVHRLYVVG